MKSKASVVTLFVVGMLVIGGVVAAYVTRPLTCEGKVMGADDTCVVMEDGQQVVYEYDAWHGMRAGQASMAGVLALLMLGGLCYYLYPTAKKAPAQAPAPTP